MQPSQEDRRLAKVPEVFISQSPTSGGEQRGCQARTSPGTGRARTVKVPVLSRKSINQMGWSCVVSEVRTPNRPNINGTDDKNNKDYRKS